MCYNNFKEGIIMYFKVVNGAIEINAKRILEEINLEIKDKDHFVLKSL